MLGILSIVQAGLTRKLQSSICAFTLPPNFKSGDAIALIATHVDSCCLKVRPVSKKEKGGYLQVACELYGGGIWRTWSVLVSPSSTVFP